MARRKGWDSLSAAYRNRLQRKGITQESYQAGTSLSKARGHERKPGQPSERYTRLVRKAQKSNDWQRGYSAKQTIDYAMAQGYSMAHISRLLDAKALAHSLWLQDKGGPGSASRRAMQRYITEDDVADMPDEEPTRAFYWYH